MQATRVNTWREGLDVHRLCIFIEIDQRITPGCPARQKRRPGSRHTTSAMLIEDAVDFPAQRRRHLAEAGARILRRVDADTAPYTDLALAPVR